jgi:scyllo-inositol 2-dehydrogenase (NADP+)
MGKFEKAKDIKVGVIGYGGAFNMGRRHLADMKKAGMSPVAVAEVDPERLKVAEEDFPGIDTYGSVTEMLKKSDVNLVVLITPHNTHAKLALQCLRAGRSVISEKPLAITTKDCDAMIAEAKKRGLLLTTYHNRHWDGCVLEALK